MDTILIAVAVVGAIGLVVAVVLSFASAFFAVPVVITSLSIFLSLSAVSLLSA